MPLVEQQPEPGRSSHGSPSELLSWLFFLIDLVRDPHFSTINSWVLLENELMLLLFCRNTVQVGKGTLCTRTNQCAISISQDTPCSERSLSEGAPKCFSCLFIMCACACWWEEGKKGPHSRVCCIIMSSKVGTAGRCQLHYTRQHPKCCGNITSTVLTMNGWEKDLRAKE